MEREGDFRAGDFFDVGRGRGGGVGFGREDFFADLADEREFLGVDLGQGAESRGQGESGEGKWGEAGELHGGERRPAGARPKVVLWTEPSALR